MRRTGFIRLSTDPVQDSVPTGCSPGCGAIPPAATALPCLIGDGAPGLFVRVGDGRPAPHTGGTPDRSPVRGLNPNGQENSHFQRRLPAVLGRGTQHCIKIRRAGDYLLGTGITLVLKKRGPGAEVAH